MPDIPAYTDYHPRWLRRRVSTYWWLEKWSYFAFVLREGSCLFVGWFVVYYTYLPGAIPHGLPYVALLLALTVQAHKRSGSLDPDQLRALRG